MSIRKVGFRNTWELTPRKAFIGNGTTIQTVDIRVLYTSDKDGKTLSLCCEDKGLMMTVNARDLQKLIDKAEGAR